MPPIVILLFWQDPRGTVYRMKVTTKNNTSQLDNKDSSIKPDIKKVI